ncbi:acetyl-CoA synthetase-like protein [Lichtheimia hyalospora FSU 10163]|nr:acetyl-CoA synthetase-like protein [Lichtheimia hyalospora FSU 10163]
MSSSDTSTALRRIQGVANHLGDDSSSHFEKLRIHRRQGQAPYATPLNPIRFLLRSAMVYRTKLAMIDGDRQFTYQELADRVHRFANVLIDQYGVQPGDRVAILCQNIPAFLESKYAVPAAGGIMVPLNTRLAAAEVEYVITHSGASVLIVQQELLSRVSPKIRQQVKMITVQQDTTLCAYEQLIKSCTKPRLSWNALPLTQDENALLSINYTSGSTGRPKGVMVSYRSCYMMAVGMCMQARVTPETVYLWTLPMFHCNGWNFPWALVAMGATQVMLNGIDYTLIWKLLKAHGITHYCGAPTVQNEICNHKDAVRLDHKVLTFSGGAALSSTRIKRLHDLNIVPTQVYGLTETMGPCVLSYDNMAIAQYPQDQHLDLAARIGYGIAINDEMRVLNKETAMDVPPDGKTVGEICITGNFVMLGYYNDPEETAKAFRHGVFWTGDLGVRHEDGSVEIVDRSKDVVVSGGENISSIEVENVVVQLDAVSECAIIAGPDEKWGERPYAFIVLRQGHSLTEANVIDHCRKNLAGYKCPSKVIFTDNIPKTSTGKFQKFILREQLWKSYSKRVN